MIKVLNFVIYWAIILLPFSMAISPVPANVFMGLIIAAFLIKRIMQKNSIIPNTEVNLPLILFFLLTCASLIYSTNFKDTFRGGVLRLLQFGFVFLVLTQEVRDRKHILKIFVSVCLGLSLASLDGFWQLIFGRDFIRGYLPILNIGLLRATASFSDANTFGIFLSAFTPLVVGFFLYFYKGKARLLVGLAGLLALAGIAITYSRPSLLAIYIVFFFFAIVKKDKALIWILIIFTLSIPFIAPKSVKNWAKEVDYNFFRFMCNDDRIAVYRHSLFMIKAHPILGLGANTYMKNYRFFKEKVPYRNAVTSDYMTAHNNFLQLTAELGLTGLLIFLWLLFKLFAAAKKIYLSLSDSYLKITALSLAACVIAFLVNGLTESSLFYSRMAPIFWYLSGLLLGLKKFSSA